VNGEIDAAAQHAGLRVHRHEQPALAALLDADAAAELCKDFSVDGGALGEDDRAVPESVRAEEAIGAQIGERWKVGWQCSSNRHAARDGGAC